MASSEYPEFVIQPDRELLCCSCRRVSTGDPRQTPCGHLICSSCVSDLRNRHGSARFPCPAREELCDEVTLEQLAMDYRTRRATLSLQVHCDNKAFGCEQVMEWQHLKHHLQHDCIFTTIPPQSDQLRKENERQKHELEWMRMQLRAYEEDIDSLRSSDHSKENARLRKELDEEKRRRRRAENENQRLKEELSHQHTQLLSESGAKIARLEAQLKSEGRRRIDAEAVIERLHTEMPRLGTLVTQMQQGFSRCELSILEHFRAYNVRLLGPVHPSSQSPSPTANLHLDSIQYVVEEEEVETVRYFDNLRL